ncbi:MAG: hypothetical protein HC921_19075, partial [Synechococcaceae cyanobacterium SM2_3_1]|nr:hypothetical protein [Synechococcaceae cyanobacterium SM2_3_1]
PLQRFLLIWNGQGLQLSQQEFDCSFSPLFLDGVAIGSGGCGRDGFTRAVPLSRSTGTEGSAFLGLSTVLACVMMTSLSGPLYQIAVPLHRIQFPWRWMVVTTSTVPLLLGYFFQAALRFRQRLRQGMGVGVCLGLLAFSVTLGLDRTSVSFSPTLIQQFATLMAQRPPFPQEPEVDPDHAEHFLGWHWAYPQGLAFVDAFEYRPLTASNNPVPPPQPYELASWLQGSGPIQIRRWRYGERQIRVEPDPDRPRLLALRTFAYPGWGVWRDGQAMPVQAGSDGRLVIPIPPQATEISVIYQGTLAERGGTALTWMTLLGLLGAGG